MRHAVPVYSQYMSIAPEVSADRTVSEPWVSQRSTTVAPADWRSAIVIRHSRSCSSNSFEPTT